MTALTLPAGPTTDKHRVLTLPVVQTGQVFHDADMAMLAPFLQTQGFDAVQRYYDEASHGALAVTYDLFGWNVGPHGPPLTMPSATRSYYNPPFVAGGLRAITSSPKAIVDGTEALVVQVESRLAGRKKTLMIPFATLTAKSTHGSFPVDIVFTGSETCSFDFTPPGGIKATAHLHFTAKTFTMASATLAADLAALSAYLNGIAQTASPGVFAPVSVVASSQSANQLGDLIMLLAFKAGAAGKGVLGPVSSSGLSQIGLDAPTTGAYTLPGDLVPLTKHLANLLEVAQANAGFATDPLLNTALTITAAGATVTIDIDLSSKDGGEQASIALVSQTGLEALGFDKAAPNPGGPSSADWADAINNSQGLVNDAFTAALARIGGAADEALGMFNGYNAVQVIFIEPPGPAIPPAQRWSVDAVDYTNLRGLFTRSQAVCASSTGTTITCGWIISLFSNETPDPATIAHETGHSLGYPDLYSTAEYRHDLRYLDGWSIMSAHWDMPHHCGAIKMYSGWIGGDPGPDGKLSRVVYVPTPGPAGPQSIEALLVPNEYWDGGMEPAVRAAFPGVGATVAQLVHIDLGGDGNQFDLIEARQTGVGFSRSLPTSPALLVLNVLDFEDDTRYAVDGLYRRKIQRLNTGLDLVKAGDVFDFATAPALQAAGLTVTVVGIVDVVRPAGTVHVFHVRVDRQAADFIDLAFTQVSPNWFCPDIWVDWTGDNPTPTDDPKNHHTYPAGMPFDQGEAVRVPPAGSAELHWVVARVWNFGTIPALNISIVAFKSDPGSGDHGQFKQFGSGVIPQIDAGLSADLPIAWMVEPTDNAHLCMRAVISDWTVPDKPGTITALGSDDLTLSNNWGQKNVGTFVAATASPYPPIDFNYLVSNDGPSRERAYLLPDWLPPGVSLHVWPAQLTLAPKTVGLFRCQFRFDSDVIDAHCKNDASVLISAWRRTPESCERWGSCKYQIDFRTGTQTTLHVSYGSDVGVTGVVTPDPGGGQVRIRVQIGSDRPAWFTAPLIAGAFSLTAAGGSNNVVSALAMYDGSAIFAPSSSPVGSATRQVIH